MSAKKTSEREPLAGRRILVTRAAEQAAELAGPLSGLGAEPVVIPTIAIGPPPSYQELDRALARLDQVDYLLLTSANAVTALFARLAQLGLDAGVLAGLQTVAVGPKSAAALAIHGVKADLVPDDYRAEGVVELLKHRVAGKCLLYPKAALARDLLPSALSAAGAEVLAPVAYASAAPADAAANLQKALVEGLDLLTFTASSTVNNFTGLLDNNSLALALRIPVASIGPLTSETARQLGFKVVIEPANSTLEDLIAAIVAYYERPTLLPAHGGCHVLP